MSRAGAAARSAAVVLVGALAGGPILVACSGPPDGLHGRFVAVSDTGGGDTPVTDGELVVVPDAAIIDVLPDFVDERPYLQAVHTEVAAGTLDAADARRYPLDGEGRFTFDVGPGDYLVCYATTEAGADPALINACERATLPEDADLRASIGEGPFVFTVSP